jgi:hypothetical protein
MLDDAIETDDLPISSSFSERVCMFWAYSPMTLISTRFGRRPSNSP